MARVSGVSIPTIKRLEATDGDLGGRAETGVKIIEALESAGVIFVEENGEGPGVRLRKASSASGPATDVIERMEADIAVDRQKPKRKP